MASIFTPVARLAASAGKGALKTVAYAGASTLLAGGAAAVTVGGASAYLGLRTWDAARGAGIGGMRHHRVGVPFTKAGFNVPTAFNTRTQALVGLSPFAIGAGMGTMSALKSDWDVSQAVSTGAVEVERPQFMGATGSLTLSMFRNRNRRARMQNEINTRNSMFGNMNLSETEQRHLNAALLEVAI